MTPNKKLDVRYAPVTARYNPGKQQTCHESLGKEWFSEITIF